MKSTTIVSIVLALLGGLGLTLWAVCKKDTLPTKGEQVAYVTSPEGIQYRIEKATEGKKPSQGDLVKVHYTGWLDDQGTEGRKFDSSVDRGIPFSFRLGAGMVIPGWDITLADMKEGETRYIILSPDLGYGSSGVASIPPHSTLRFRVELLEIVKK